jgi:hypothetical protein
VAEHALRLVADAIREREDERAEKVLAPVALVHDRTMPGTSVHDA